ncbi:Rieske (2Fe-2S) protein [Streptomyces sp. NPDC005500]|uniref:Rieske (2Fe-2S) protein n=1 Tax=Streptomyces sp. NPDC005500 TaxID=3155007 RepID=UPI0033ADFD36
MNTPSENTEPSGQQQPVDRRRILMAGGAAAAASLLTACVIQQPKAAPAVPAAPAEGEASEELSAAPPSAAGGEGSADPGKPALAKLNDVPVGGGVVLKDQKIVVTRDSNGAARAFSAVCTHQGCTVASVSNGTINCPCHGSKFDATSGQPVAGPAKTPLAAVAIQQRGDAVYPA